MCASKRERPTILYFRSQNNSYLPLNSFSIFYYAYFPSVYLAVLAISNSELFFFNCFMLFKGIFLDVLNPGNIREFYKQHDAAITSYPGQPSVTKTLAFPLVS